MSRPVMFYGWKIVLALFVMLMFSSGLGFYNHSVIIQALSRNAAFSVETVSLAVSLFFLVGGLSGLVVAPLLEKFDIRYVVTAGVLLCSASLWALGGVQSTFELMLVYSFFGMGFSAAGLLPATTLVARWFEVNRAKALSLASTGLSVGGIVLTPASAYLVEQYSLAEAGPWLGGLYLICVLPLTLYFLRSSPGELGLRPDGRLDAGREGMPGISFSDAIRQQFFWGLSFTYVLTMAAQVGGIAHQYGVLSERLTVTEASWAIAIMPGFSVIGRLIGGVILDRFNTLKFTALMMVTQGSALMLIGFANAHHWIYLGLTLFGVSVGNLLMLQPLIVAEVYGLKHYARVYSWSNLITMAGVSGGPLLLGSLFGFSGSYLLPYLVAGSLGLLAAAIFVSLKLPTS